MTRDLGLTSGAVCAIIRNRIVTNGYKFATMKGTWIMNRIRYWGLRMLCLALCLACLVNTVPPVQAVAEAPAAVSEYINTCLIYNGPSAGYAVIGRMEDGTAVTVLGQRESYYKIDCYDMIGYIAVSQVAQRENGEYYIQCAPESSHTQTMVCRNVADALLLRAAVLELARQQLGDPYVYGGERPGAFDCSGLTSYVYGQNGYQIQRGCSGQLQNGLIVSREGLQVGDLIFFRSTGSAYLSDHVGIYVGDGQIIHAGNNGVCYASLDGSWFVENYLCARRIVTVSAQAIDPAPAAAVQSLLRSSPSAGIRTAR